MPNTESSITGSNQNAQSSLHNHLFSEALRHPGFSQLLQEAIDEISEGSTNDANEATIAGYFERELYGVLREISIRFHPVKEELVDTHRHTGTGRLDSRINAVVIEYKRPSKLLTDSDISSAKEQLEIYLNSLTTSELNLAIGYITDGNKIIEMRCHNGQIVSLSSPQSISPNILVRLIKSIYALQLTALTPENLIRDFCGETNNGILFNASKTFHRVLCEHENPKTRMLQSEWEEIFRLGHNDNSQQRRIEERRAALSDLFQINISDSTDEYRALFALHTSYALVVKLIAYRVVSELRLSRSLISWNALLSGDSSALRAFCSRLEEGEIFRQLGILNLLEGDFFSWYADSNQWNHEISDEIKSILETLGRYEQTSDLFTATGAVDLFRDLYEKTVPQPVRSSFGEFYTPSWLANHVIDSTNPKGNWRLLDPCCGSGTFLVVAIDLIRSSYYSEEDPPYKNILKRVVGFDLNPLAVLTARVNYFIHISDILPDDLESLIIPVFLGDATNIPPEIIIDDIHCIQYELSTLQSPIQVILPKSLINNTPIFVQTMNDFENEIINLDIEAAINVIQTRLSPEELTPTILSNIRYFAEQIIELERKGWNGVWARILTNILTTASIGKFDLIVGNPPWIDWKNLPASYRDRVKSLCIDKGLFSGDGRTGGINLNICALISHTVLIHWLKRSGCLAFLMPKVMAFQQSYQGWRNLPDNREWRFSKFIDWSDSGNPFDPVQEDFMTYLIEAGDQQQIIPLHQYTKIRGRSPSKDWQNIAEALNNLVISYKIAGRIIPESTAYTFAESENDLRGFSLVAGECSYIGREGVEFYPQELFLFSYQYPGPSDNTVFLRNIQKSKSKYHIPARDHLFETLYLYPLIKGPSIKPFNYDDPGLIVSFPYKDSDPHRPIPINTLREESQLLLTYYRDHKEIIESQTGFSDTIRGEDPGDFYGLARTGPYSFQDVYVCYRDNTKWVSAVVTNKQMPWGETKRYLFQNHAVSICEKKSGGYINIDEAHYICAILNAPIVKKYIYASSDSRSFKIRPPIFVPEYNPENSIHLNLSQLSKDAHNQVNDLDQILTQIDSLYLDICTDNPNVSENS